MPFTFLLALPFSVAQQVNICEPETIKSNLQFLHLYANTHSSTVIGVVALTGLRTI